MLVKRSILFIQALLFALHTAWAIIYSDFDIDELCDYTCGQSGNSWYVAVPRSTTTSQYNANSNANNKNNNNNNNNNRNRNQYYGTDNYYRYGSNAVNSEDCRIKCLPKTQAAELILQGKASCGTVCAYTEPVVCDIEYIDTDNGGYVSYQDNQDGTNLVKACTMYYMPYMIHYTNANGSCHQYCVTQQNAAKYLARGGACGSCDSAR
ncbi:hypothetical protein FisN_9Lh350 [Fistulifera solaris]|uniref:Uncharacterized protein n=1 Tax=Fistulifera solaris TaxID=1519565 RepID=A0A1Z5KL40_FISSO|nr:hypothetical protein FisN_9Lh350 [Fistulifera solaris]|eukprot:GAX27034.1 hypothetical protein FisN_9Lh350 [Fistulifera solaris]